MVWWFSQCLGLDQLMSVDIKSCQCNSCISPKSVLWLLIMIEMDQESKSSSIKTKNISLYFQCINTDCVLHWTFYWHQVSVPKHYITEPLFALMVLWRIFTINGNIPKRNSSLDYSNVPHKQGKRLLFTKNVFREPKMLLSMHCCENTLINLYF